MRSLPRCGRHFADPLSGSMSLTRGGTGVSPVEAPDTGKMPVPPGGLALAANLTYIKRGVDGSFTLRGSWRPFKTDEIPRWLILS
jgi:hypothetical protein